ncbi:MAG: alkaline shock response membrane anchor protein AmaP [Oscillospiraceae bacterium]|nr:alkaline shock response membrane anchor protein AmaP [Oscillospiraceae bacterium]MDD4368345.1 alkaline shock response membrane anchor protein AmaP [Oscillospiraceae bacterium]
MRRLVRLYLIISSILLALTFILLFFQIWNTSWAADFVELLQRISFNGAARRSALLILFVAAVLCILMFAYALVSGRMAQTRIRSNEIGDIEIGVDALENIALNAAKAAQAGVKAAKARVSQNKNRHLIIVMIVVLYSDVEIPSQMAKIQDHVKKDVERYTGIPVSAVKVKVNRVETLGSKVE